MKYIYNVCGNIDKYITSDKKKFFIEKFSSNKCRASNKPRRLINAAPLGIYIEISESLLLE